MKIVETEAIVLYTRDYGESDRLISFYTRTGGRLTGIAKGARRSRKRFVHTFEPGSLVQLGYRERRSLVWIETCRLMEPHLALRAEIDRWLFSALVSEIVLELVPEGDAQEDLFFLLSQTLSQLAGDKDPLNVILIFAVRFLDGMGYLAAMESCSVCRRDLRASTHWCWRMDQGRLTCIPHCTRQGGSLVLDLGTLVLIRQVRQLPLDRIWRLRFTQERKLNLFGALMDWIQGHIHKELKSLRLLHQVQWIR